ncbi:hypothetical protein NDU88_009834 [Pleurodeles waltl]|uniref:Endonuclease/exonuclease/phosphatase domain-containing protein n=1 Tax=Pleurodeles waltl TaxID=8319 RepID=A0AAV7PTB7_PLEWA|nr:hypothetical protein NDU88_009834 [Pleurodeles waltl]
MTGSRLPPLLNGGCTQRWQASLRPSGTGPRPVPGTLNLQQAIPWPPSITKPRPSTTLTLNVSVPAARISYGHPLTFFLSELQPQFQPQQTAGTPETTEACHNLSNCLLLNIRSLHKHTNQLWDLINFARPDIAFLTETWTNPISRPDIAITIPDGYNILRKDRPSSLGGGLVIIHNFSLRITVNTKEHCTTIEHPYFLIHGTHNSSLRGTWSTESTAHAQHALTPL